jgi:hypothetical protein
MTLRRALKLASVLIIVLIIVLWTFSYHSFEFKGGLGIHDSGFFSYPRYHAEIGELPLWKDGEYQFAVRGLPTGPLDLMLKVADATDADRTQLTSLSTTVNASITDRSGKDICTATGKLADARDRAHSTWVLASSASGASFWQPRCQQLPIKRSGTYLIKVAVLGADDRSPHRMLRLILQGGGNELP